MKKLFLVLATILAIAGCSTREQQPTLSRTEALRAKLMNRDTSSVIVVAHRGDWRYAPENSIAAIEHSIAVGVDVVEIDLQLTKDSNLIVMHDATLDRTTTGSGKICDWTLDSIKTLNLKSGCGLKTKHKVPTLEEAMLAAKGKVLVNLDKADRYFDLVMPVLEKTGTASQVIMKGKKPAEEVIGEYGEYLDSVIYMPIVNLDQDDVMQKMDAFMTKLKPVAYEFTFTGEKGDSVPRLMRKKVEGQSLCWYNTLWDTLSGGHDDDLALEDPDASYGFLIDTLGARIIQTDRAEYLLNYLKARHLHE